MHLQKIDETYQVAIKFIDWMRKNEKNTKYSMWNYTPSTTDIVQKELSDKNSVYFLIEDEIKKVGVISLNDINFINRNAEIRFMVDHEYWGKGYATFAGEEIIKYAFNTLNLLKLWLGTAEHNKGMRKVAEKIGMKEEFVMKHHLYIDGDYQNILRWYIFNDDKK